MDSEAVKFLCQTLLYYTVVCLTKTSNIIVRSLKNIFLFLTWKIVLVPIPSQINHLDKDSLFSLHEAYSLKI